MRTHLLLSLILATALPAFAADRCNDVCLKHFHEGQALAAKGKVKEAFDSFEAARLASPQASLPWSAAASLFQGLSESAAPDRVEKLRNDARSAANRALALDPDDSLAQEALRHLDADAPSPLRLANPAAAKVLDEAEVFFTERRMPQALAKYREAMVLDPQVSIPWVGAGDCYYFQKQWKEAEALFRRATEIEPRNSQAWRFLSDALVQQDKRAEGERALLSAIAADPGQLPNWGKLAQLRADAGLPLEPLRFYRGVHVVAEKDGNYNVQMEQEVANGSGTPDTAFRLALALAETSARIAAKTKSRTPFDIELDTWRSALSSIDEANAASGKSLADPALRQMQQFAKDGQLEAAILMLLYRQSYRTALDAWLAREPGGVKQFTDRYGIRP